MKNMLPNKLIPTKETWRSFGQVAFATAFFLGFFVYFHIKDGIATPNLTRDLPTIADLPPYFGFISQIGVVFWVAATAICFFSSIILSKSPTVGNIKGFLVSSGILSMLLGFDDMFLFHEQLMMSLGIPELVDYLVYAAFLTTVLFKFRLTVLRTDVILLAFALLCFAVTIALKLSLIHVAHRIFFEDSSKLMGIISWFFYFYRVCVDALSMRTQKN